MKRRIIAIVGPTASGKTNWGVYLAKKIGGEIISADSRQVYKKLDIGTGKDLGEYGKIRYHLIDICEPGDDFTMFDWLDQARIIIDDIFSRGKTPIVVGGTGLYVQALVEGFELAQAQSSKLQVLKSSKVEKFTRQELDDKSVEQLQKICKKLKAENFCADFENPRRLVRAIELAQGGVRPIKKKPNFEVLQIGIETDREKLYEKIDRRVDQWFEEGLLQEVQQLLAEGIDSVWLEKIGLEYGILTRFLLGHPALDAGSRLDSRFRGNDIKGDENNIGRGGNGIGRGGSDRKDDFLVSNAQISKTGQYKKMIQEIKFANHSYARRQMTWFGRFPEIVWIRSKIEAWKLVQEFLNN